MGYDDWGRLLNDDCGSGGWGQTFSYDQYNNLTKAVISGRTGITFNPGYSSSNNQYASSFGASYDSNGNLTNDTFHVYEWNEFSKMKSVDRTGTNCVTSGECIVYDALGRMVEIDSASTNTEIWYTQGGAKVFMSRAVLNYAYWPAPGGGTVLDNGNGGSIYYEHKDWLGSARVSSSVMGRAIIDDRAFAPYGEIYGNFGSTAKNENIFGGGMIEGVVTGTFDADNREYNGAAQGRWISPDPAGAGWNQYGYTTNPNSGIDPTGLSTWIGNPYGSLGSISGYGGTAGFAFGTGGGATSPWTIVNGTMAPLGLFVDYNPSIWVASGSSQGSDPNSNTPPVVTFDSNGNVLCPGSCPGLAMMR